MPKTPLRAFRIPDSIYLPAVQKARENGDNLSEIVRDRLLEYVYEDEDEDEG